MLLLKTPRWMAGMSHECLLLSFRDHESHKEADEVGHSRSAMSAGAEEKQIVATAIYEELFPVREIHVKVRKYSRFW